MQCSNIYISAFMATVYISYSLSIFLHDHINDSILAALVPHAIPLPLIKPKLQRVDLGT